MDHLVKNAEASFLIPLILQNLAAKPWRQQERESVITTGGTGPYIDNTEATELFGDSTGPLISSVYYAIVKLTFAK